MHLAQLISSKRFVLLYAQCYGDDGVKYWQGGNKIN